MTLKRVLSIFTGVFCKYVQRLAMSLKQAAINREAKRTA